MPDELTQPSNGHGGARPGAGRPRKADLYAGQIRTAEDRIADQLPKLLTNLLKLANGGFKEVTEEWQPAGVVTTGSGEFESKVFPDLDDKVLVRVKRTVRVAAPDRESLKYLIDRILGKIAAQSGDDITKHIDLSKLNPEQLERIANGDDPISILLEG